jgi:FKBP-type peptidyl-prolyl cis-trans isomerase SlyD
LHVGAQLTGTLPDGRTVYPRVAAIKNDAVVLDFNHPLAGKTLYFDVKILDIADGQSNQQP